MPSYAMSAIVLVERGGERRERDVAQTLFARIQFVFNRYLAELEIQADIVSVELELSDNISLGRPIFADFGKQVAASLCITVLCQELAYQAMWCTVRLGPHLLKFFL